MFLSLFDTKVPELNLTGVSILFYWFCRLSVLQPQAVLTCLAQLHFINKKRTQNTRTD